MRLDILLEIKNELKKIMQLLAKKQRVEYVHFINLNIRKLL